MRTVIALVMASAAVLIIPPAVRANHERFLVGDMTNADLTRGGIEVISGKCIPSHDRLRLDCYFTQVVIDRHEDTTTTATSESEMVRELDKPEGLREFAKICKSKLEEDATLAQYNVSYKALMLAWRTFCAGTPTKQSVLALMRTMKELDAKKCRIIVNAWRETFTRNIDRWTSRKGPSGLCGVVQTNTLRPHDLAKMKDAVGPVLWSYETHSIYTRPADEDNALLCSKKLSVQNDRYAWNARVRSLLCEDFDVINGIDESSFASWEE